MSTVTFADVATVTAAASLVPCLDGFLRKPPVDRTGLEGDFEDVRDDGLEDSVCAGDTSLDSGAGSSNMDSTGGKMVRLG